MNHRARKGLLFPLGTGRKILFLRVHINILKKNQNVMYNKTFKRTLTSEYHLYI